MLVRYDKNGRFDRSFGHRGKAIGGAVKLEDPALVVDPDGKLTLVGGEGDQASPLIRLDRDGHDDDGR